MEGTLESLHQRPRRAGKQAAPDVRVQRKQKYIQSVFSEEVCTHGPPSHHGCALRCKEKQRKKIFSCFLQIDQHFCREKERGGV